MANTAQNESKVHRTSLEFDSQVWEKMRKKLFITRETMKDYIQRLISEDVKSN